MLFSANGSARQPFALQASFDRALDLLNNFLAVAPDGFNCGVNSACAHGIQGGKAQFLKFHSHRVHAKAIGYRRIDVQSFLGDSAAFFRA